jgi:type I restriction enzyme, R subunit
MKFTEAQLEKAIIDLLGTEGYRHVHGGDIQHAKSEVPFKDDLKEFLLHRYAGDNITSVEYIGTAHDN